MGKKYPKTFKNGCYKNLLKLTTVFRTTNIDSIDKLSETPMRPYKDSRIGKKSFRRKSNQIAASNSKIESNSILKSSQKQLSDAESINNSTSGYSTKYI